jgi:hypothetical protein
MIESSLKLTPGSQYLANASVIDEPLQYVTIYLEGSFQAWINCENNPVMCQKMCTFKKFYDTIIKKLWL